MYSKINRMVKTMMKEVKRNKIENCCTDIENCLITNNSKKLFSL